MSRRARRVLWLAPTLLYLLFWVWYTPFGGPLTTTEIEGFAAAMEAAGGRPERLAHFRRFFAEDDGRAFVMVNVLEAAENPRTLPATGPGATAEALMGHYMAHMFPALLSRACHPVFVGAAVFDSLDLAGIEGADTWSRAALMRYRSRRDLLEILLDPATGERHQYKLAALDKTVAFPVVPQLSLGDLRLVLGLVFLAATALIDALVRRSTWCGDRAGGRRAKAGRICPNR